MLFHRIIIILCICLTIIVSAFGAFMLWASKHYTVPIMMYHNVNYTDHPKANTVSPENFERHMAYLNKHGYNVLRLDELVEGIKNKKAFSRKTAVITFDDAYADNYTNAFGILKKYKYPATMFIPSDFIERRGYLTLKQIREMIPHGIDIGSHSRRHAYLPDLSIKKMNDEIRNSKSILEKEFEVPVNYFAYPIGGFSGVIKNLVKAAGYKGACATNRGYDRFNEDVFELKRIRFGDNDTNDIILWAKLSGYYNLFRQAKEPH